ncbi:MAG: ubiquinol-cytochrome C chaperone family protein [Pseudomonadota bacterium]|uniref:ubiquinol-cytochrome C chaperone family protein n=1 Tax=Rhizorhabdus phycosphaerae TaxID=2711156 RepID=UPI0013EC84DC|nr:ubiquinol-cytochrome C chaperone family protein [Rhizorhabdus phycosphaerae]
MRFFKSLFGIGPDPREALIPLYSSAVAEARRPLWYADYGVPDTLDGRFDMVTATFALLLLRAEREGDKAGEISALLTELFIEDMEGQVRQLGIGDVIVGKHLGKMVSAMGGRLLAYREGMADREALTEALVRNLWRGEPGPDAKPAEAADALRAIHARMEATGWDDLIARGIPA